MRRGAGLDANQAGRQLLEENHHLAASQLLALHQAEQERRGGRGGDLRGGDAAHDALCCGENGGVAEPDDAAPGPIAASVSGVMPTPHENRNFSKAVKNNGFLG